MATIATPTVTGNYHTPICGENCNLRHHDLVKAMFHGRSCTCAQIPRSGDLPVALKQSIQSAKLSGWDQNSDIPDPLEELRCPLLFLACAFGKSSIVKALLQNNFDPRVVNQHGETALHHTAQHLWSYKVRLYKVVPWGDAEETTTKALESFERIVQVVTDCDPRILAMKDDSGRTALHVLAVNIMLCQNHNSLTHGLSLSKAAHFHQLCLKSIIRRLLKLLDASIFTKREVIEIITTAESTYGDSVLHILARDSAYGFEVLKFLQDWLFAGKLPEEKNSENKTVLALARDTDPQGAKKMLFLNSPVKDLQQLQQCQQGSSTQSMQFDKTLISNNGKVLTTAVDVDDMEPQTNQSSNLKGCPDLGTGNPFPQCTLPVNENEGVLPYITQVFSLSCKEGSESSRRSDPISHLQSLTMLSNFEFVKSPVGVSPTSANPGLNNACTWVETHMNANKMFGLDAIAPAMQNGVSMALTHYSDKLRKLEESLPKLDQIIEEAEAVIDQKMARVNILEKELDLVRKDAFAKMKSMEELRWKKEQLCKETKRLKRRVDYMYYQEKQNQLVYHSKKVRLL
ncbi:hypothetical protein ACROYT_G010460 [Oculina patagonica]